VNAKRNTAEFVDQSRLAGSPRAKAPQLDAFLAQDAPHRIIRDFQRLGQRAAIPARQTCRGGVSIA